MKKIAIITHLKPINDPRHFHKIALSLAKTNKYEINIIGIGRKKTSEHKNITFCTVKTVKNRILNRLIAPWKLAFHIATRKANLVIINHPELLIATTISKWIYKFKLVYDIQENYQYNIKYQNIYHIILKSIISIYLHIIHILTTKFVDHFILAEQVYKDQLHYTKGKYSVLENKAIDIIYTNKKTAHDQQIKFVFTGNISQNSGADKSIKLFQRLSEKNASIKLKVIGHCPDPNFERQLKYTVAKSDNIHLVISHIPIDYSMIIDAIASADIAIIAYNENKSNIGKVPTKYFEYNFYNLPYLVEQGSNFSLLKSEISIPVNFETVSLDEIIHSYNTIMLQEMQEKSPYGWSTQEESLIALFHKLIFK